MIERVGSQASERRTERSDGLTLLGLRSGRPRKSRSLRRAGRVIPPNPTRPARSHYCAQVFWLAHFALQRGETEERRNILFEEVCPTGMGETEKSKCCALWHSVHKELMSKFVEKIDFYLQRWLCSPAAKAYKDELATLRYSCSS